MSEAFSKLRLSAAFTSVSCLLSRFLYALDRLGKLRGGQECVERAFELLGKAPDIELSTLSRASQFHQYLVQICVNLHPAASAGLKAYFIDLVYPEMEISETLAYIFTILLNDNRINEFNQRLLIRGLLITQSNHCIKYINDYRNANGLPQLLINENNLTIHGKLT